MEYVAFLLGINLGMRSVKMADLKALLEKLGYTDVRTILASGNVRFSAGKTSPEALVKKLEAALEKKFGFKIGVIVRTVAELEKMRKANPFKSIKVTSKTRRYVTFLALRQAQGKQEKPKCITDEYAVLKVTPGEVYSWLELNPKMLPSVERSSTEASRPNVQTPDVMKLLGKSYGKKITTRSWNTIQKVLAL
jgi:uncharacterized protein (DUF1697 family)